MIDKNNIPFDQRIYLVLIKDQKFLGIYEVVPHKFVDEKCLTRNNQEIDLNFCFQYQDDAKSFAFQFVRSKLLKSI